VLIGTPNGARLRKEHFPSAEVEPDDCYLD
jgi:hypothetical protein